MTSTPALFDFLDRSHQELQRQLVALRRLVGAVADDSLDAAGRDELKCTIAWFNREARQHHQSPGPGKSPGPFLLTPAPRHAGFWPSALRVGASQNTQNRPLSRPEPSLFSGWLAGSRSA